MDDSTKAILLVPLIVFGVVTVFFAFGYLVTLVLRIPFSLGLALPIRLVGALVLFSRFVSLGVHSERVEGEGGEEIACTVQVRDAS